MPADASRSRVDVSVAVTSAAIAAAHAPHADKQRAFCRGIRPPGVLSGQPNPVAKPPRSFADMRMAAREGGGAVPDSDWLARIAGSGVQPAAAGAGGQGTARKWVKNLPAVKTSVVGISRLEENITGRDLKEEAEEEEMAEDDVVIRPRATAADCLEQLKFSTKSILDQHRYRYRYKTKQLLCRYR
jgi:hypothetical protein